MRNSAPALLLLLAGITGCGPVNRGLSSVNQPVVTSTDYALELRLAGPVLAQGEQERVARWFEAQQLGYGDRVALDGEIVPSSVRKILADLVSEHGLLLSDRVSASGYPVPAGRVRVIVARSTASVPGCPNWERKSQPEFSGSSMSNYGCAVNSNLAAMIADPLDLVRGSEGSTTGDPRTTQRAIQAYREQEATGKKGLPGGVTSVSAVESK